MQLLTSSSADIFLVEDISEMLELLDGLGISVRPVCFTCSGRNSKDCGTNNS